MSKVSKIEKFNACSRPKFGVTYADTPVEVDPEGVFSETEPGNEQIAAEIATQNGIEELRVGSHRCRLVGLKTNSSPASTKIAL